MFGRECVVVVVVEISDRKWKRKDWLLPDHSLSFCFPENFGIISGNSEEEKLHYLNYISEA